MPVIKNVTNNNIVVFNKIIEPNKSITITTEQLDDITNLIENKYLKIEIQTVKRLETEPHKPDRKYNENHLKLKDKIITALFDLHLKQNLSSEQIADLIWFFKNAGPTSQLNDEIKNLLDDVQTEEELIETLLNHLYPELIKNYLESN